MSNIMRKDKGRAARVYMEGVVGEVPKDMWPRMSSLRITDPDWPCAHLFELGLGPSFCV